MLFSSGIVVQCILESKDSKVKGWLPYLYGKVGNLLQIEGSETWWRVAEVHGKFPSKMVLDPILKCKTVREA